MKILIVDDSAFFRNLLKEALLKELEVMTDNDIHISEAHNTFSAMQQIGNNLPELVFLDVVMQESETEGVKILKKIRDGYPNLKVIMLTSVGQNAIINQCKELGIEDYITKPFEKDRLKAVLKKFLI